MSSSGMSPVIRSTDRAEALAFIAGMQADPALASGYLDTLEEGLEQELEMLQQPWMETLRVIRDDSGALTGAVVVSWDTTVGQCQVYGPWTTRETWDTDALPLLRAAVEQANVPKHEIYTPLSNTRLAELAVGLGWPASRVYYVYIGAHAAIAAPDPAVRRATLDDLAAVYRLHAHAFPNAYATAEQLLDPQGKYTTLVIEAEERVVGYAVCRIDGEHAYVDFISVDPGSRGQGYGRRIFRAAAHAVPADDVRLVVQEDCYAAIRLFESLEMTQGWATRGFRSQDPSWLVRTVKGTSRVPHRIADRFIGPAGL